MDKSEMQKIFTPEQYKVELFKDKGYIRKECTGCKHMFWTLDQDRNTCGDTPCEGGYSFINRKGKNWDFHETISQLTSFFEKHGHTSIEAYPTVARWRDDLEFTIASIADFQPWVTNGTLDPPANPLTVPQPCIRFGGDFSDTDNVGRTGRHLTSFIMFGQHAFNSDKLKGGYWMDRCIDLNFKFLTERLGLKPEEVTYIEGIWAGGGNFGPNLESFAFGTEIVNSVFMQYEETDKGYKDMDIKVIDVGWGLERVSWFSQGTPTIYEATFGPVLDYMKKETGIKVDQDLLVNYSKLAGLIDINEVSDVKSARANIAERLGYSLTDLNSALAEIEALYAIGDHSRTVAFTLADGAIPSNVGGGYNLRSLIRRMFTINEQLELDLDLSDIIDRTITYVSQSYPRLKEARELVPTIMDVELLRHKKTIASGRKFVNQLVKQKKEINDSVLVDMYTSRGIPPESVQSIAMEKGITVDIPMDFYQQVDKALPRVDKGTKTKSEIDFDEIKSFETQKLYYEKQHLKRTKAKVVAILDTGHVIFDKTIFYPLGGGQAEDSGTITFSKNNINVEDVKKFGNAVVHKLSKLPKSLKVGSTVTMNVDWERRLSLTRHHTAVHIVGGAAREVLGSHVWQAGADKTPERARLDITHWEGISRETLDEIEFIANSVVMDNRRIKKHVLSRDDAEQKFGFTIYQGGVVPGKELRIVEIPGIDTEACGGTHADATGDIGYIRILGAERIQDGIVRLTLTAGKKAVTTAQHNYQLLSESADVFSVIPEDMPKTSDRFFSEWKEQRKIIERLSSQLAEARIPQLIDNAKSIRTKSGRTIKLVVTQIDAPQVDLIISGQKFSEISKEDLLAIIIGKHEGKAMIIVAKTKGSDLKLSPIIRSIGKLLGGGGGGKKDVIAGGGPKIEGIEEALAQAESIVIENL